MDRIIYPGTLRGAGAVPPSKSDAHRLLIAAYLSGGRRIAGLPDCEDVQATSRCLDAMTDGGVLSFGESASTMRFLLPVVCALGMTRSFTMSPGLAKRPAGPFWAELKRHGAAGDGVSVIGGSLKSGVYRLDADISSQFVSGLLFALPLLPGDSRIVYRGAAVSRPYIDMTARTLALSGIVLRAEPDGFQIPGGQRYDLPEGMKVERDWSAAAYWLCADRLGSAVTLTGMNADSRQGDRTVTEKLAYLGGRIDLTDTPDLLPPLAVTAAAIPGIETVFTGVGRLRYKESDRVTAVRDLIRSVGGTAESGADTLTVRGARLRGGRADGQGDHRIVMSAALAALAADGPVTVTDAEKVNKSWPSFFEDFAALGGRYE